MSHLTGHWLTQAMDRADRYPRVFIESGTWEGRTALAAAGPFPTVATVEIDPGLFQEHRARLRAAGIITLLGDSADLIPALARLVNQPVCWFLDGHYTDQCAGAAMSELPLWAELEAIASRPRGMGDLVLIDDVHMFGTDHLQPAWRAITHQTISELFYQHGGWTLATTLDDVAIIAP